MPAVLLAAVAVAGVNPLQAGEVLAQGRYADEVGEQRDGREQALAACMAS